jgi:transposase, IS4 family
MSDHSQLAPLIDGVETNLGRRPKEACADAGYLSEAKLAAMQARGVKAGAPLRINQAPGEYVSICFFAHFLMQTGSHFA